MSRSNPRPSSIVASPFPRSDDVNESASTTLTASPTSNRPRRRRLAIRFAAFIRWLHIYVSMFGLIAVLFFSVTGVTLNHPDWFLGGMESRTDAEGGVDPKLLTTSSPSGEVAKLEVVEHLRGPRRPGRGRRVPGRRRRGPGRLQGTRLRRRRLHQPRRRPVHPQRDGPRPGRRDQRPPQGARLRPGLVAGRRRLRRPAGRHLPVRPDSDLLPQAPPRTRRRRGGRGRSGRRPALLVRRTVMRRGRAQSVGIDGMGGIANAPALFLAWAQAFRVPLRAAPINSPAAPAPSSTTLEGSGTELIWMVAIRSFDEIRWEMS